MNISDLADKLKEKNLSATNMASEPVHPKDSWYVRHGKRIVDIVISLPAVIVLLPVNALLALITFFDVGRPVLFKQQRSGLNGKPFIMYKFRNMTNQKDQNGELLPPSQRITKFGRFVRKTSIDELLNFFSILKGDMSIIGPRPLPISFYDRYSERHKHRCDVRPGLECPLLHDDGRVRHYDLQFENDVWYVENVSLWVDVQMFFGLFAMVFNGKQRKFHANVDGGDFVGYDEEGRAMNYLNASALYQ